MNGYDRIIDVGGDVNSSCAVAVHGDDLARARVADFIARNDVTVAAACEAGLQRDVHGEIVVVDSDEGSVAARECDLMPAIVPPVGDRCVTGHVTEDVHVVDLTPTMLTDPAITTSFVTF